MKHKEMILIDPEAKMLLKVHNCYIAGEMSDGTKVWKFDEMDEDGTYIAMNWAKRRVLYRI